MVSAAAVAGSTTRRVGLSKVAADKYAAAFLRLRVVCKQPETLLILIASGLELRHDIADACSEVLGLHGDMNASFLPLNEACLLEIRKQHLTYSSRYASGKGERLGGGRAFFAGPGHERGFEALEVPHARTAEPLKVLVDFEVGRIEQQNALCRMAVTSGAPDLLDILLQRAWGLVMQDVADVGLVDAHAKGGGRDHDQASGRLHELTLGGVSIGSTHLAVIARDRDACAPECARDFIDGGGRGAIDDARALQTLDAAGGDGELGRTGHNVDGQAKVLAVSRADNYTGIIQAKPFGDVLPDPWGCRCRKGKRRRVAKALAGVAEAQ